MGSGEAGFFHLGSQVLHLLSCLLAVINHVFRKNYVYSHEFQITRRKTLFPVFQNVLNRKKKKEKKNCTSPKGPAYLKHKTKSQKQNLKKMQFRCFSGTRRCFWQTQIKLTQIRFWSTEFFKHTHTHREKCFLESLFTTVNFPVGDASKIPLRYLDFFGWCFNIYLFSYNPHSTTQHCCTSVWTWINKDMWRIPFPTPHAWIIWPDC